MHVCGIMTPQMAIRLASRRSALVLFETCATVPVTRDQRGENRACCFVFVTWGVEVDGVGWAIVVAGYG